MPEGRKFTSLEDWRKAEGKDMSGPRCQECGRPLKDAKYKFCYDCNQKRQGGGGGARPAGPPPSLPDGYLRQGYFTDAGHLRDELVTTQPMAIARAFTAAQVTTGQIRRFYGHLRGATRSLETGADFAAVRPRVLEMLPLVADAAGRAKSEGKDYEILKQFIDKNVDEAAKGLKELTEGFVPHFQYVVAYFKYLNPKEGRG